MQWNSLNSVNDIHRIVELSKTKPQVIFKHSTRCSISSIAKMRVEDNISAVSSDVDFYYLDLIKHKDISSAIASELEVHHESPQMILLIDGIAVHDASHFDITIEELNESLDYHLAKK